MATLSEAKGMKSRRKKPVVVPQPYTPDNQYRSKEEFVAWRKKQKEAQAAADEARRRVLADNQEDRPATKAQEPDQSETESKIANVRKALAAAEEKLSANPKSKALKKKVESLQDELEVLESEE